MDCIAIDEIELIRHEMDMEWYGMLVSWMLVALMFFALIYFAIPAGMEKSIKEDRDLWKFRCATQKLDPNYCKGLEV